MFVAGIFCVRVFSSLALAETVSRLVDREVRSLFLCRQYVCPCLFKFLSVWLFYVTKFLIFVLFTVCKNALTDMVAYMYFFALSV